MQNIEWVWDPQKNLRNINKHGLSFDLASHVFDDPLHISGVDPCSWEHRMRTIGRIGGVTVIVVHTPTELDELGRETGRIVSARKATRSERMAYENV
jgi:uncharacterized DUF497 family protein